MGLYLPNWKADQSAGDPCREADPNTCNARLWAEVIRQAYDDVGHKDPRIRRDASDWFMSERREICSFLWVCDMLGLDPGRIRKRVFAHRPLPPTPPQGPEPSSAFYSWRKAQGLTLERVAGLLGCTPVTVRNMEREIVTCGQFIGRYMRLMERACAASTA